MASGSRSTPLVSILTIDSFLAITLVALVHYQAGVWVLIVTLALLFFSVGTTLFAFLYLLMKDPELLRSERYALQKMAIEKNLVGDNLHGVVVIESKANESNSSEGQKLIGK
jgi:hypothetical protein